MANFRIKKISLVLAGLGLAYLPSVNAQPISSSMFNLAKADGGWFANANLTLVEPFDENLQYATLNRLRGLNTIFAEPQVVDPGYNFGFSLGIGYQWANKNDIAVDYSRFCSSDTDATNASGFGLRSSSGEFLSVPGVIIGVGQDFNFARAAGSVDFTADVANIEAGHTMGYENFSVRPFLSIQYAHLTKDFSINASGNTPNNALEEISGFVNVDSEFNGGGPRLGFNVGYKLGYGVSLVGSAATELLVGTIDVDNRIVAVADLLGRKTVTTFSQSDDAVVPGFEASIGLAYQFDFSDSQSLDIIGGYTASKYLNISKNLIGSEGGEGGAPVENCACLSDFAMQGFYLGLAYYFGNEPAAPVYEK